MTELFLVEYMGYPLLAEWSYERAQRKIQQLRDRNADRMEEVLARAKGLGFEDPYRISTVELPPFRMFLEEAFNKLEMIVPDTLDGQDFMISEAGEVASARAQLRGQGRWKRSHPEHHRDVSIDEEVGDTYMMAHFATDFDPVELVKDKLRRWGWNDACVPFTQEILSSQIPF